MFNELFPHCYFSSQFVKNILFLFFIYTPIYEVVMQNLYRYCIFLLCFFEMVYTGTSQINTQFSSTSTRGREFWLAVPLNDSKAQPRIQLEFYVTSSYNTVVTLEVPGTGFIRTKKLKANEVAVFSSKDGSASYDFEIVSSQIPDPRGIHITADEPISVYMMNAKEFTSDGYLALPVSAWGTEYTHCSYYDFGEFRKWGGGFIVVASEDKTEVSIELRGRGGVLAKTRSGSKIGQILTVILNKGEVYNVVGDGMTEGVFDLTGSKISANKPIGVISYHERTTLPINAPGGRNHMCEMTKPVNAWGKQYYSIELERANKGDFYRVVASKANTRVNMKYYDKVSKTLLGQRDIVLAKAGDFYEDFNTWAGVGAVVGFNGTTVWEADKPILVMQYAYSADWDSRGNFDPFMMTLTAKEQFLSSVAFQTPVSATFENNYFSFIIEGDTTDINQTKLKSLIFDGKPVYKSYPQLLINNIPNSNLYWGRLAVAQGAHIASSETVLGGYVYGFGLVNSYGWPTETGTLTGFASIEIDTLPPVLTKSEDCGDFSYRATELRNFIYSSNDSLQKDRGISDIYIIDSVSYNYNVYLVTPIKNNPSPKVTTFDFKLVVKDRQTDAFAVVVVEDQAGNRVFDTVRYHYARQPTVNPSELFLEVFTADTTLTRTITVTNPTNKTIYINSIHLDVAEAFTITGGAINDVFALAPSATHTITIDYTSITAATEDTTPERDFVTIALAACRSEVYIPLEGKFIKSSIKVSSSNLTFHTDVDGMNGIPKSNDTDTITISNKTNSVITLHSVYLHNGSAFSIIDGKITSDISLHIGAKHTIIIRYNPSENSVGKKELDTLHVEILGEADRLVTLEGNSKILGLDDGSSSQSSFAMTTTPNPADESVMVTVNGSHPQYVHLLLYDAIGREIAACSTELTNGSSNAVLPNISSLPIGAYRLVATGSDGLILSSSLLLIQR